MFDVQHITDSETAVPALHESNHQQRKNESEQHLDDKWCQICERGKASTYLSLQGW